MPCIILCMITNTFSILNGIGQGIEKKLWGQGILSWDDFRSSESIGFISGRRKLAYDEGLEEAMGKLHNGDVSYFTRRLKQSEHWRLFETFSEEAVCLDIETTGIAAADGGKPTVVGLYDGREFTAFVKGRNLSSAALMDKLSRYKYLITFYGSVFDIPFLKSTLPGFRLDVPHFDLCFGARALGMKGGLKKLEPLMGIKRTEETSGLDGYDAVLLWRRARRGDERAMRLLVEYNREDTVNLMTIARNLYPQLRASTGIEEFA